MLRGTVRPSYGCGRLRKASEGVQMNDRGADEAANTFLKTQ